MDTLGNETVKDGRIDLFIAGIQISIRNLELIQIPFSPSLLQFQNEAKQHNNHCIDITLIDDCPDPHLFKKRVIDRKIVVSVLPDQNETLFSCHTGQFFSRDEFSKILLWSPFEAEISNAYDGYPLLQIILWGKVSFTGGAYMHGSLMVVDEHYILLLGDSGVGKSTLSQVGVDHGYTCLTDENPFLTAKDGQLWAHASPWHGVTGPPKALSGQLSAIFFLRHFSDNVVKKLTKKEAGRRLMGNVRMFNWFPQTIPRTIGLLNNTLDTVPIYDFGFIPTARAIDKIREVL